MASTQDGRLAVNVITYKRLIVLPMSCLCLCGCTYSSGLLMSRRGLGPTGCQCQLTDAALMEGTALHFWNLDFIADAPVPPRDNDTIMTLNSYLQHGLRTDS